MKNFTITNTASGHNLGTYKGNAEADALDAMYRAAGYESRADALGKLGQLSPYLVVTEVAEDVRIIKV